MYVTWGQIETTRDEFRWDKIDTLLNALPAGKKMSFSLSWQGWGGVQACPNDMLDNPAYDGGQRVRGAKQASGRQLRSGVHFATIHMPRTMDRYLAFTKAFAARYDADPRLAFVTSAEIPYEASLKVGQYKEATARANMYRLTEMVKYFPCTPCGVLGAWWSFGGDNSEKDKFAKAILEAGGGFGFPDLDGNLTGGHYKSHFRPHVLANAGKWPCWMGVEWQDLMPERTGPKFPDDQIAIGESVPSQFHLVDHCQPPQGRRLRLRHRRSQLSPRTSQRGHHDGESFPWKIDPANTDSTQLHASTDLAHSSGPTT